MAIGHVVTIHVAPGSADDFADAFKAVRAIAQEQEGREQYELFQSLDEPEKVVLLERWTSQELLKEHMDAERTRDVSATHALVALWAPGFTPRPKQELVVRLSAGAEGSVLQSGSVRYVGPQRE
jgi:quinol monooxygenase YgiN